MTKDKCRKETERHIQKVRGLLLTVIGEVLQRASRHDASKLKSPEFDLFVEYTPKLTKCTYGSKQYKKFLKGLRPALNHHYKINRHHPEFFIKGIKGMNLIDLLEMLCDWIAAAQRDKNGNVKRSIILNAKRFGYSNELEQILLNTLRTLK